MASIEDILGVIRSTESGNNYTAINGSENPAVAASGAYQFIGSTWRSVAARSGVQGATTFSRAVDAPPDVQDAVARWYVQSILDANGGNSDAVWSTWYVGGYDPTHLDYVPAGANSMTVRDYINTQRTKLNGGNFDPTQGNTSLQSTAPRAAVANQNTFGQGSSLRGPNENTRPPDGGFLINVDGQTKVVYNLGPNVDVYFDIDPSMNWDLSGTQWALQHDVSSKDVASWVRGGSASELSDVTGDLKGWVDKQINILLGGNTEAAKDPEVRRIFLDSAVNPEISDAEIQARLHQTKYWQSHTQNQLDWNDLSTADQQKKIDEEAANLVAMYVDQVGEAISISDPTLRQWAVDIASGKRSEQAVLMQDIRGVAAGKPGSPWSAQLHTRENTLDQTRGQLEKLYNDWGLPVAPDTLQKVTERVASGETSLQDITDSLKNQAAGLYPTKPSEIPTATWADPYLQTYQNVMEVGDPGIFHTDVQKALTSGMNLGDFRKTLMLKPEWANTRNGKDTLGQAAETIGSKLGFA